MQSVKSTGRLVRAESSAPGKAIVVGEHGVVYGGHAVALPVTSARMSLTLTELPGHTEQGSRIYLGGQEVTSHLDGILNEAFQILDEKPRPLNIEGLSTVVIGAGMGSSASLCVSLLAGVARLCRRDLSGQDLAHFANLLERRFHGNPSGLDTAVVALEQPILFRKGATPQVLQPAAHARWRFILIDSGTRAQTSAMVTQAKPYFLGSQGALRVKAFDDLALAVAQDLTTGNRLGVAEALTTAHSYLTEAGVVTAALENLVTTARNAGALAAKVTGAGGGGCILALLDPENADIPIDRLNRVVGGGRILGVTCE
jgi:mevalonate kinase